MLPYKGSFKSMPILWALKCSMPNVPPIQNVPTWDCAARHSTVTSSREAPAGSPRTTARWGLCETLGSDFSPHCPTVYWCGHLNSTKMVPLRHTYIILIL